MTTAISKLAENTISSKELCANVRRCEEMKVLVEKIMENEKVKTTYADCITKNGIKTKITNAHPNWFANAHKTPISAITGVKYPFVTRHSAIANTVNSNSIADFLYMFCSCMGQYYTITQMCACVGFNMEILKVPYWGLTQLRIGNIGIGNTCTLATLR